MARADINEPGFWGRLLMVGIPGPRLDEVARELVRDLKVGGIILFARNLESPEQVWELTRDLQREALAAAGRPLFIAVDQEGGPVQRLKSPFTLIPSARELGGRAGAGEVERLAGQVARELSLVGINVNLAPVLDVARGPQCPQWERAYGPDPELVAALGVAAIRGYLSGGVIPVAKHFPGLGDTLKDSHQTLPRAQFGPPRTVDLLPFERAIAAGVPAIMTAHVLVPEWDSRPATLSRKVLAEVLRRELQFSGVVITDDLEMGAIAGQAPAPEAACEALAAGADLLLICRDWQAAFAAATLMARDGGLASRAEAAAHRQGRLRQRLAEKAAADLKEVKDFFSGGAG
jgi:beta-N-acetylhexosaminidase